MLLNRNHGFCAQNVRLLYVSPRLQAASPAKHAQHHQIQHTVMLAIVCMSRIVLLHKQRCGGLCPSILEPERPVKLFHQAGVLAEHGPHDIGHSSHGVWDSCCAKNFKKVQGQVALRLFSFRSYSAATPDPEPLLRRCGMHARQRPLCAAPCDAAPPRAPRSRCTKPCKTPAALHAGLHGE